MVTEWRPIPYVNQQSNCQTAKFSFYKHILAEFYILSVVGLSKDSSNLKKNYPKLDSSAPEVKAKL